MGERMKQKEVYIMLLYIYLYYFSVNNPEVFSP